MPGHTRQKRRSAIRRNATMVSHQKKGITAACSANPVGAPVCQLVKSHTNPAMPMPTAHKVGIAIARHESASQNTGARRTMLKASSMNETNAAAMCSEPERVADAPDGSEIG